MKAEFVEVTTTKEEGDTGVRCPVMEYSSKLGKQQ
jgi:hypothetical protein